MRQPFSWTLKDEKDFCEQETKMIYSILIIYEGGGRIEENVQKSVKDIELGRT